MQRITAASVGLACCENCSQLYPNEQASCPFCAKKRHKIRSKSLQTSAAWLLTAIILYFPANLYPIMQTNFLGEVTFSTIIGGVATLWMQGSYPIAVIIFIASVVVPVGKILTLAWLLFSVNNNRHVDRLRHQKLYRTTELIGKWSMVDVFVVAILVTLIQMGQMMSIYPGPAALAFAGLVIASMLAALSFDSRLIWKNNKSE
ncbi:paraquat-inducible protein A [Aliikangiella sp. IMCC44653]